MHRLLMAALVVIAVLELIAFGVLVSLLSPFWILLSHLLRLIH